MDILGITGYGAGYGVSDKARPAPVGNDFSARGAENRSSGKSGGGIGALLPEDRVSLSGKSPSLGSDPASGAKGAAPGEKVTADGTPVSDPQVQQVIARLKANEEKVKAHEASHKAAGGSLASSATYSYTQGPDGRRYITGGEVQIDMSGGRTPEETISRMQQVIRAALAPADPSGQDRSVASQAASRMAQAQQEKVQQDGSTASQETGGQPAKADGLSLKEPGAESPSVAVRAYGDSAVNPDSGMSKGGENPGLSSYDRTSGSRKKGADAFSSYA